MEINILACINRNKLKFNLVFLYFIPNIFRLYSLLFFRRYDLINGGWGWYGGDRATYGSGNGSSDGRITPEQRWIALNTRLENIR